MKDRGTVFAAIGDRRISQSQDVLGKLDSRGEVDVAERLGLRHKVGDREGIVVVPGDEAPGSAYR